MTETIKTIKELLGKHIEATNLYAETIEKIKNDADHTMEAKTRFSADIKERYTNDSNTRRDAIINAITELKKKEKTTIDLSDNRLSNAMSLLKLSGNKTADTILRDIENQFIGDQASLEVLKGIYDANGISTISLDRKMYNVNEVYNELAQGVYDDFRNPEQIGKLNRAYITLDFIEKANEPASNPTADVTVNTMPTVF